VCGDVGHAGFRESCLVNDVEYTSTAAPNLLTKRVNNCTLGDMKLTDDAKSRRQQAADLLKRCFYPYRPVNLLSGVPVGNTRWAAADPPSAGRSPCTCLVKKGPT
jgi:hypothetical protein